MEVAHEGVTAPIGFQAAGVNCGIKKLRKDVALVVSATPAVTAAMFTTNSVVAAPVVVGTVPAASTGGTSGNSALDSPAKVNAASAPSPSTSSGYPSTSSKKR